MSVELAKQAGLDAGYQQGLAGKEHDPPLELLAALTQNTHLHVYLKAYDDGYKAALSDRAAILEFRRASASEREKSDVSERSRA